MRHLSLLLHDPDFLQELDDPNSGLFAFTSNFPQKHFLNLFQSSDGGERFVVDCSLFAEARATGKAPVRKLELTDLISKSGPDMEVSALWNKRSISDYGALSEYEMNLQSWPGRSPDMVVEGILRDWLFIGYLK